MTSIGHTTYSTNEYSILVYTIYKSQLIHDNEH